MTLFDPARRQRKTRRNTIIRFLFEIVLLAAALAVGFQLGLAAGRGERVALKDAIADLEHDRGTLESDLTRERSRVTVIGQEYKKLRTDYLRQTPDETTQPILALARDKMEAGIPTERLMALLNAVRIDADCDAPEIKRFMPRTPLHTEGNDFVRFFGGLVTVTGEGASALSPQGKPEAWYNSAKPVKLSFAPVGGNAIKSEGLLPIHASIIDGSREIRITVTKGETPAFVEVIARQCRLSEEKP